MTVSVSLPPHSLTVHPHSRFESNEEDWYKAYGSAIVQGHMDLLEVIQAARKSHPNGGERHRFLMNQAQGNSPPATE